MNIHIYTYTHTHIHIKRERRAVVAPRFSLFLWNTFKEVVRLTFQQGTNLGNVRPVNGLTVTELLDSAFRKQFLLTELCSIVALIFQGLQYINLIDQRHTSSHLSLLLGGVFL